jgi:hypothetical protein
VRVWFLYAKIEYSTKDFEDSIFVNGLYLSDADWNSHYVSVSATITLAATVFLTFDPVQGEVILANWLILKSTESLSEDLSKLDSFGGPILSLEQGTEKRINVTFNVDCEFSGASR